MATTGIRSGEIIEKMAVEKTSHAKEKEALIQYIVQTRMYLIQIKEEYQFLRDATVCLLSPAHFSNQEVYDQLIKNWISEPTMSKLQETAKEFTEIVEEADKTLVTVNFAWLTVHLLAWVFPAAKLQATRQEMETTRKEYALFGESLDKAATIFNSLTAEDRKAIHETLTKRGFPLSPAFVNRCERVAKQAIAA